MKYQLTRILWALVVMWRSTCARHYTPDWPSLDSHPLPQWYEDAKVGVFIHWGVFSVPAFKNEWFWWRWQGWPEPEYVEFMQRNYPPNFSYFDFAAKFTAQFYEPDQWADLFKAAGARYVVLTTKHHEGFCMWPSKYSWNWNAMDVGPKRDLVGDLANSIRNRTDLRFGVYHSLFEWFNPLFRSDEEALFLKRDFVERKTMPELMELVHTYKPDIVWSDGQWIAPDTYWQTKEFLAWLFNESPVKESVVVNDRWGAGDECYHGDIHTCTDRYNPGVLLPHKWENCMTLDRESWGYRNDIKLVDVISIENLISQVVTTVSCGGNILINIGPTKEGVIIPIFEERLRQLGTWLGINGEAIYSSRAWRHQNDSTNSNVWYTKNGDTVYAILLKYPNNTNVLRITSPQVTIATSVTLLGYEQDISWKPIGDGGMSIELPHRRMTKAAWAWTFKLTNVH